MFIIVDINAHKVRCLPIEQIDLTLIKHANNKVWTMDITLNQTERNTQNKGFTPLEINKITNKSNLNEENRLSLDNLAKQSGRSSHRDDLSLTGFTLLETVLAVFVVAVVVTVMIDIFISSTKGGAKSSNLTIALSLAQSRMEEIKNLHTSGTILLEGSGSNTADNFLPALTKVSVNSYPTNLYLTESNYYQANYGTPSSLSGMTPSRRIDRITQLQWVDDPTGGSNQDYLKVTVTIFWKEEEQTTSVTLVRYVYQKS